MRTARLIPLIAIAASTIVAAFPATAAVDPPAHEGHAATEHRLSLDHGRKWATDEPLRQGMAGIRAAIGAVPPAKKGVIDKAEYRKAGVTIEKNVADIVARCKLPPEADANLHLIVAELVGAADALQGKSQAKPEQGLQQARRAVIDYGRFFDDRKR